MADKNKEQCRAVIYFWYDTNNERVRAHIDPKFWNVENTMIIGPYATDTAVLQGVNRVKNKRWPFYDNMAIIDRIVYQSAQMTWKTYLEDNP